MPLDALSATHGGLDEFRINSPSEMLSMLRKLQDGNVLLNLSSPAGTTLTTQLLAADATRGVVSFSADAHDPRVQYLVEDGQAVVVGHLDSIKVQFNIDRIALAKLGSDTVLTTKFPREMFRFQRRSSFRVRPLLKSSPTARLRHPSSPDLRLTLRVLDVSLGGCAVLLTEGTPAIEEDTVIAGVQIDLDADTRFTTSLRLQHVTIVTSEPYGLRLGCQLVDSGRDAERALQFYIDQTQKRRRMLALD